jgi:hypothetical protein
MKMNETDQAMGFMLVMVGSVAMLIFGINAASGAGPIPEVHGPLIPGLLAAVSCGAAVLGSWILTKDERR